MKARPGRPFNTKKKLHKNDRDIIKHKMSMRIIEAYSNEKAIVEETEKLIDNINTIIRGEYPESDMQVLRKYGLAKKMTFIEFIIPETGHVFGYSINHSQIRDFSDLIVDAPYEVEKGSNMIFRSTAEFKDRLAANIIMADTARKIVLQKNKICSDILNRCLYLEDVDALMVLPQDIRDTIIGVSTASKGFDSTNTMKED